MRAAYDAGDDDDEETLVTHFDSIVIGAGQAGPSLATRLAASGQKVAIVERKLIGGTCVNVGCMPTKTLVASARAAHVVRRAAEYGVEIAGPVGFDLAKAKARATAVSTASREGLEAWLRGTPGLTVLEGHARFVSATALEIGGETFEAERFFINVGGRARVPRIDGVDTVPYLTSTSILALEKVPRHLVVVGGGPIGLEFAQMYRRFGSDVTLVELSSRLLEREDEDVSAGVKEILEGEGVRIHVRARGLALRPHADGVEVRFTTDDSEHAAIGSHVLIAAGRQPNTDDLGLDAAGIRMDARGYIEVDETLRTSVSGIWALGEVNGRGAFTHTAYNDFEIVAANLLDGEARKVTDRIDAWAIYIDPQLARLGLSETAARNGGRAYLVAKRPMTRVSRAVEKGESQGFMKVVVDAATKKIVGATILGTDGDEVAHGLLYAMYAGATAATLTHSVGIHPTVSELLPTLLGDLKPLV